MVDVRPASVGSSRRRRKSFPNKLSSTDLRQTLPDGTTFYWSKDAESSLQRRHQRLSQPAGGGLRRTASDSKLNEQWDGDASDSDAMPRDRKSTRLNSSH